MFVRAVRGAITVENNSSSDILNETEKLLETICNKNVLQKEDIISVIFTMTKDLNAEFPALAARKMGWNDVSLLCTNEIDVPEGLKKCIRVLIHFNTEKNNNEIQHIYLNNAKSLRPDISNN